jgi:hypothetical protein
MATPRASANNRSEHGDARRESSSLQCSSPGQRSFAELRANCIEGQRESVSARRMYGLGFIEK